jgi:hypothetical protein
VRARPATGATRGFVAFFSGDQGAGWWSKDRVDVIDWFGSLQQSGLEVAEVRWDEPGWLAAAPGEQAGPAALACRPATIVRWLHDQLYVPLGLGDVPRACGFCITGNSGGSTQVAYTISHYGLDSILGGVFPTSGPTHAALRQACLGIGDYSYQGSTATSIIDRSYGFAPDTGPCSRADPAFAPVWDRDSVESQGTDYFHPNTRITIFIGSADPHMLPHAQAYDDRLVASGTSAAIDVLDGVGHEMMQDANARAALRAAFLGG